MATTSPKTALTERTNLKLATPTTLTSWLKRPASSTLADTPVSKAPTTTITLNHASKEDLHVSPPLRRVHFYRHFLSSVLLRHQCIQMSFAVTRSWTSLSSLHRMLAHTPTARARSGGSPILAIATEQGTVHTVNTQARKAWDPEPVHTTLQPHNNGIFDVKWNATDNLLATASGDRTGRVCDVETSTPIHTLGGHFSTLKCVSWNPRNPNLVSSGGREGMICVWDIRAGESRSSDAALLAVQTILAAHEDIGPTGKRKEPKGKHANAPRTVTGLSYSDMNEFHLITSGSADGILRCWDLRTTKKVKEPACVLFSPQDATLQTTSSRRPRGIISLAQGCGPSVGLIFALAADARIYTFDRDSLTAYGHTYTHTNLRTNFYVGLSTSPCGRWLASGGAGIPGSGFMFDVSNATRGQIAEPGVELKGYTGECGGVDWADGMLATAWDDGVVRVWRPRVNDEIE
ncbi:Small monomeric GTPase [Mycena indigotica]|uniref:Small monomeric GTPase n=1 Tax=Mycena indigotica TaxID=2126181 RepID=A0A8H6W6V8_9AGAR|nr:Small monomeric GTPase [Mycena indigotica]KAF7301494.1 Small monomeric GTPase [Mycena indigotica]